MRGLTKPGLFAVVAMWTALAHAAPEEKNPSQETPVAAKTEVSAVADIPAGETAVDETYLLGHEAFQNRRYRNAVLQFERVLEQSPASSPVHARALYNLGRCAQLILEQTGDSQWACRGADWFETFLEHPANDTDSSSRGRANVARKKLLERCQRANALMAAAPPKVRSNTKRWASLGLVVVGVGGMTSFSLAQNAADRIALIRQETLDQRRSELAELRTRNPGANLSPERAAQYQDTLDRQGDDYTNNVDLAWGSIGVAAVAFAGAAYLYFTSRGSPTAFIGPGNASMVVKF